MTVEVEARIMSESGSANGRVSLPGSRPSLPASGHRYQRRRWTVGPPQGVARGRFLVLDHEAHFKPASQRIGGWLDSGELLAPETVSRGFVPGAAFVEMMGGANFGKAIVDVVGGERAGVVLL